MNTKPDDAEDVAREAYTIYRKKAMMETADRAIGEIGRLSRLLIDKQVDIERLRVALGVARGALVSLRDGAQADGDLGKSSLIQTHINIVDRAYQQKAEGSMVITDHHSCPVCLKVHPGMVCFRPPTKEQEDYLRNIEKATDYDPTAVIGGPKPQR